ncbi:MAG TPA: MtrB/PioB family outer membrane beta-barrel protein, partial [Methylomirabilota bacterium]|nr:MtrB/PioB family outer membrane beta-barrel protein [Methylomirabilota bacterium]
RWHPVRPLALTLGAGWEHWDRNQQREVPTSDEAFGKAAVDLTPVDWFLARLTYRPSLRRIDEYNTHAHHTHTVEEDPAAAAQSQSILLRKFDEGERDRHSVELMLQFVPVETLTATVTAEWRNDDYVTSALGLQDATRWAAGFDTSWRPVERVALSAGYVHELIYQKQRSRSRPVTGANTFDFPDFDWISVNTDTIDTFRVASDVVLVPRTLHWNTSASYAYALGRVETRNPIGVASGTAAQRDSARARPWPAFEDQLLRIDTALRYEFWKNWTASLGYAWESYQKNDWRTDRLNPFVSGVSSIWLGADQRNYDAHILTLILGYRFR